MLWQELYGVIPNVKGKGKAASQVSDILLRMQREQAPPLPASVMYPHVSLLVKNHIIRLLKIDLEQDFGLWTTQLCRCWNLCIQFCPASDLICF